MLPRLAAAAILFAVGLGIVSGHAQFGPAVYTAQPSGGGANNTAIDGSVHKNVTTGSSTTLPALTTGSAGDRICVVCTINGTYVTSVTSTNVTFTNRHDTLVSGSAACSTSPTTNCLSFFSGTASGALSSEVITVTLNGTTSFLTCDAFAIKNQTGFDANAALPTDGHTGANLPVATISTSNANDMLLGFYRFGSTANPTAGAGWTAISGADFQLVEFQKVTVTQTNSTATIGGGASDEDAGLGDAAKSN